MSGDWERDMRYEKVWFKDKKFNQTLYRVEILLDETCKSTKIWIAASSGRKRKHLENYEDNEFKRDGGIKALLWIKNEMLNIPKHILPSSGRIYLCIAWSDSRRRDIYKKLHKEGFKFHIESSIRILRKRIK